MSYSKEDVASLFRTLEKMILEHNDRILELEAQVAFMRGTRSVPEAPDDQPEIVHDVAPNAPR